MKDRYEQPGAHTERRTLSDGSYVYDVVTVSAGHEIRFGCVSEDHAIVLSDALNRVAWIETDDAA